MANFDFVKNIDEGKSEFERSLDELCAYDVAPPAEKKQVSGSVIAFNIFRWSLLLLFVGIFVYCVFMIGKKSSDYVRAGDLYEDLAERFDEEGFVKNDGMECCECGCCSFVCPAKRPLTQQIKSMRKIQLGKRKK